MRYLSFDRYVVALKRIREQISQGSALIAEDSNEIGNKYTSCTWGLCSNSHEQWPDKQDHLFTGTKFEKDWEKRDFVAVKYRDKGQMCPFDKNDKKFRNDPLGCFYRCKVFQDGLESRKKALELYDIRIKEKTNE